MKAFWQSLVVYSVVAALCAVQAANTDGAENNALPRVSTQNSHFILVSSGDTFRPRGFNYIRLYPDPGWHTTFAPDLYEPKRAEAMLSDLEESGFNVVRVFIDHRKGSGVTSSGQPRKLCERYMSNFLDFLKRATDHGIYVVPSLNYLPRSRYYRETIQPNRNRIRGHNQYYLQNGFITAKCRYLKEFVSTIKQHRPSLLSTIFAFELENETRFVADKPPFSLQRGTLRTANGQTYQLHNPRQKQRMADENVIHWVNRCTEAVKSVDPEAMVGVDVFTFRAVGRSGPGRLGSETSHDARFPARPTALACSRVSYIDIHSYPHSQKTLVKDLKSVEFARLRRICRRRNKPLIMGEFGAFKKHFGNLNAAAQNMERYVHRLFGYGFQGFIYWTYDTDEQEKLWNAKSGRGQIFRALSRASRRYRAR